VVAAFGADVVAAVKPYAAAEVLAAVSYAVLVFEVAAELHVFFTIISILLPDVIYFTFTGTFVAVKADVAAVVVAAVIANAATAVVSTVIADALAAAMDN
jgi:hypothetical protein